MFSIFKHDCAPFIFTVRYVQENFVYGLGFEHLLSYYV